MTIDKQITDKEKRFCLEYIANNFNACDAAKKAGYSEEYYLKNSYKLPKKLRIKEFIAERIAETEKKLEITFEWKLLKLKNIIEDFHKVEPKTAINAISELNKMQGHYSPEKRDPNPIKLQIDADISVIQQLILDKNRKDY